MPLLVYNSIDLSANLCTLAVDQSPAFDPSNTDQLFTKISIHTLTTVTPGILPAIGGEQPGDTVARLRHLLTAPRRPFTFSPGGAGLQIDLPGGLDDNNGPKPTVFSIQPGLTTGSFIVSWGVEICLVDCGSSQPPSDLSIRYRQVFSMDRNWAATVRTDGRLIISSRSTIAGDALRGLVTPSLSAGFRRETAEYGMEPSGLVWGFAFSDKQLHHLPPFPALELKGGQIESIPLRGGLRKGELVLSLNGAPGTSAVDLLQVGVRLALARINVSNPFSTKDNKIMMGGSIRESLDDDRTGVDLRFEWNLRPPTKRITGNGKPPAPINILGGGFGVGVGAGAFVFGGGGNIQNTPEGKNPAGVPTFGEWIGKPLEGTSTAWPTATPTRGMTDGLKLVAAILSDPCGTGATLSTGGSDNTLVGTTEDGASVTVSQLEAGGASNNELVADDDQTLYVEEDLPGTWDFYKVTAHYNTDPGTIVVGTTVPGTKSAKVRTRNESKTLRLEWALTRIGGQPELPFQDFEDDNWILVSPGNAVSLDNADVASDGVSLIYKAAGVARFEALDSSAVVMNYPVPPFLDAEIVGRPVRVVMHELVGGGGPVVGP